jgi:hypothetical protein
MTPSVEITNPEGKQFSRLQVTTSPPPSKVGFNGNIETPTTKEKK